MALNLCPHPLQVLSVSSERSQMGIVRKNSPLLVSLQNLGGQSSPLLQSYSHGGSAFVSRAVKEEQTQIYGSAETEISEINPSSSKLVLVVGGTGGVAFPSRRWNGENTPERVDWEGVRNLVSALPETIKRIVLVSSVGVTKFDELPWSIMNLFGVLKYKKMGEDFIRNSGLPFTIIRAGRLTDGPYTSYDLNTLLQATAGKRRAVVIGKGDKLVGEVSRLVVAEACIQALDIEFTEGKIYEINSIEGEGPGNDQEKWRELFKAAEEN